MHHTRSVDVKCRTDDETAQHIYFFEDTRLLYRVPFLDEMSFDPSVRDRSRQASSVRFDSSVSLLLYSLICPLPSGRPIV